MAGKAQLRRAGNITAFTPTYLVMGRGRIDGQPVVVAGDDFTVRGGSSDGGVKDKHMRAEMMARDLRLPIVRLVDGTGGGGSVRRSRSKVTPSARALQGWGVVRGEPCARAGRRSCARLDGGLGRGASQRSHYSVMVKDTSQVFVAGPPVVNRLGYDYDKNELGGSEIHTRNGTIDDEARAKPMRSALREALSVVPAALGLRAAAAVLLATIRGAASTG